jgi:NAD(P)-dependent dehydrogenase (short-subunit alcohol dehydrogenase family)
MPPTSAVISGTVSPSRSARSTSISAGDRWLPLQENLPHAPVSGIVVQERFNDLVISTYGRGFWIMDDITPLLVYLASDESQFATGVVFSVDGGMSI